MDLFVSQDTREYMSYAMLQLELYCWKVSSSRRHLGDYTERLVSSANMIGESLQSIRGLNYHRVMRRLALLCYGKSKSLSYHEQVSVGRGRRHSAMYQQHRHTG